MLFTRWSDNNRNESYIYMARTLDGRFYEAMKLGTNINVPGYKSQQPFVSQDGKILFFSSNRPGGKAALIYGWPPLTKTVLLATRKMWAHL
jgi:OmpA-OmpF porin, OOP family